MYFIPINYSFASGTVKIRQGLYSWVPLTYSVKRIANIKLIVYTFLILIVIRKYKVNSNDLIQLDPEKKEKCF